MENNKQAFTRDFGDNYDHEAALKAVREEAMVTDWVIEAEQIPQEYLNSYEKNLVQKCINQESFTESERNDLKMLLQRYRPAINKLKPVETIENVKENIQTVTDEKDILSIISSQKKRDSHTFYYPLENGKELPITLIINKNLTRESTKVLTATQTNLNAFQDFTEEEQGYYNDYKAGLTQTQEEIQIAKNIEKQIMEIGIQNYNNITESAIIFLANQTKIKDYTNCTTEYMTKLYTEMDNSVLLALFEEVQNIIGINNINRERIFRRFH